MATCPTCGDFLDADHRCRGMWLARLRYWSIVLAGGASVGALAFVALSIVFDTVSAVTVGLSVVLGAVVTNALLRR